MKQEFRYRGKTYTTAEISFIRQFIADNPNDSRWKLSRKLCLELGWVQENGALRDMVCRSFMLELERTGLVTLPPKRRSTTNYLAKRRKPEKIEIDQTPIIDRLSALRPIQIIQVRRGNDEQLCNSLIEQYHYLNYTQPVGEHLKYMMYAKGRPVGCMTWSSAPRHIGCRDRFIGWSPQQRKGNIHLMAYNSRFLILPWVQIKYLASHLLSRVAKIISDDWKKMYHHPIFFLETFVDTTLFKGTCYTAANWLFLGKTTGRGKNDQTKKINRTIKNVELNRCAIA